MESFRVCNYPFHSKLKLLFHCQLSSDHMFRICSFLWGISRHSGACYSSDDWNICICTHSLSDSRNTKSHIHDCLTDRNAVLSCNSFVSLKYCEAFVCSVYLPHTGWLPITVLFCHCFKLSYYNAWICIENSKRASGVHVYNTSFVHLLCIQTLIKMVIFFFTHER